MNIIEVHNGDIFDSGSNVLVNTVNCVGVMGKGLALRFAELFPSMVSDYKKACISGDLKIGKCYIWEVPVYCRKSLDYDFSNLQYIVNFPTKLHWLNPSRKIWIEQGLVSLAKDLHDRKCESKTLCTTISIPALGCSLGQLNWDEIRPLIIEYIKSDFGSFEEIKLFCPHK